MASVHDTRHTTHDTSLLLHPSSAHHCRISQKKHTSVSERSVWRRHRARGGETAHHTFVASIPCLRCPTSLLSLRSGSVLRPGAHLGYVLTARLFFPDVQCYAHITWGSFCFAEVIVPLLRRVLHCLRRLHGFLVFNHEFESRPFLRTTVCSSRAYCELPSFNINISCLHACI